MRINLCLPILAISAPMGAPKVANETARNAKVEVVDTVLKPSEPEALSGKAPMVLVFLNSGLVEMTFSQGKPETMTAQKGDTRFFRDEPASIRNLGQSDLHYVLVELLGAASSEMWGAAGLSPNYKMLFENQYTRTYDIRIPAHTNEPQHTHHDRVVVCLSGATLKHRMPDGREEPSTLKTGESGWRRGGTHIGQNLGDTDLWVIAIEPK